MTSRLFSTLQAVSKQVQLLKELHLLNDVSNAHQKKTISHGFSIGFGSVSVCVCDY
jgi:hypothetical protein